MEEEGRIGGGGGRERKIGVLLEDLSITCDQHAGQWLTWYHHWHVIPTPNSEYMPALLLKSGKENEERSKNQTIVDGDIQTLIQLSSFSSDCFPLWFARKG